MGPFDYQGVTRIARLEPTGVLTKTEPSDKIHPSLSLANILPFACSAREFIEDFRLSSLLLSLTHNGGYSYL
jgi:hypothetical protein